MTPRTTIPPCIVQRLVATPLTPREQEIVWLDAQGLTLGQIAEHLTIERATVTSHWKRVQRKLGLDRQAVRVWIRKRLKDPADVDDRLDTRFVGE